MNRKKQIFAQNSPLLLQMLLEMIKRQKSHPTFGVRFFGHLASRLNISNMVASASFFEKSFSPLSTQSYLSPLVSP